MADTTVKVQRPLSPHLQHYKPQITSVLSILHRMTGVFLSMGSLLLAVWLYSAAYDIELHANLHDIFITFWGIVPLVAWSGAFYYHLCNGIRHLCWDMGKGFEIATVTKSGFAVLVVASILTLGTWLSVWSALWK